MSPLVGVILTAALLALSNADVTSHQSAGNTADVNSINAQSLNDGLAQSNFWWQNQNSPLKAAYDYYKKCNNEKGTCVQAANSPQPQPFQKPQQQQSVDIKNNPFFNGGAQQGNANYNNQAGKADLSKNPFLSGSIVTTGNGKPIVSDDQGFLGVQPSTPFKNKPGFSTTHPLERKPDENSCNRLGYVCVPKEICQNGIVNKNGEGLIQNRDDLGSKCEQSETCCRLQANLDHITAGKSSIPGATIKFGGNAGLSPGLIQVLPEGEEPKSDFDDAGAHGHFTGTNTSKSPRDTSPVSGTVDYSNSDFNDVRFAGGDFQGPAYLPPLAPSSPRPPAPRPFEIPVVVQQPSIPSTTSRPYQPISISTGQPSTIRPYQPSVIPTQPSYQPSQPSSIRPYQPSVIPSQPASIRPYQPSPIPSQPSTFRPYQPSVIPSQPSYQPSPIPSQPPTYRPYQPSQPSSIRPYQPSSPIPSRPYQPAPSTISQYLPPSPRPTRPSESSVDNQPFTPTPAPNPAGGYVYEKPNPPFGLPTTGPKIPGSGTNINSVYVQKPAQPYLPPGQPEPDNPDNVPSSAGNRENVIRPQQPKQPYQGEENNEPPTSCAAALKCVQEIYCTADGFISPVPVVLTKEQELARVPTTVCQDQEAGIIGKCCRDANYKDPWPSANLVNGIDDGQYKEDDSIGQYQQDLQRPVRSQRSDGSTNSNSAETCGQRNYDSNPKSSGPLDVSFGEIPWQAMILRDTNRSLLCGGVIIRNNAVLTAAHCVQGLETSDLLVKGGEWKLGIDEEPLPFQIIKVASVITHPEYQEGSLLNDMAILILTEKFRSSKNVGSICLPPANQVPTENCIATGWGKRILQLHARGAIMHSIDVKIMDTQQCRDALSERFQNALPNYSPNTLCGFSNRDQCRVDYGSALACSNGNQYVLSGIYSWDTGCKQQGQIGGYVAPDVDWIETTLSKAPKRY